LLGGLFIPILGHPRGLAQVVKVWGWVGGSPRFNPGYNLCNRNYGTIV